MNDVLHELYSDFSSDLLDKVIHDEPLSVNQYAGLMHELDLIPLGAVSDDFRKKTAGDLVTFVIDRNINYTNVCTSRCKFCAFFRDENSPDAYVLKDDELIRKVDEAVKLGATQILLQGGLHPSLPFEYYENMLKIIKNKFNIHLHAFSPPEVVHISKIYGASIKETISRLVDAGLDSIPGGGAEILDDRVRGYVSPNKIGWKKWEEVMLTAHSLGVQTTATMVFGHAETDEERIRHIVRIRDMQKKGKGFTAFIPWSFQSENTELKSKTDIAGVNAVDYLKTLALSRIILNNYIKNIQVSWVTQGKKVAQVSLNFGANDFGGTMIEENVVRAAGVPFRMLQPDEIVHMIKKTGKTAAQRDTLYRIIKEY